MNRYLPYDLAQARQRDLLREAEMDRLAAEARRHNGSLRDMLLARLSKALIAAGSRIERGVERPREAAAEAR